MRLEGVVKCVYVGWPREIFSRCMRACIVRPAWVGAIPHWSGQWSDIFTIGVPRRCFHCGKTWRASRGGVKWRGPAIDNAGPFAQYGAGSAR